ncbi:hypothetical protein HYQ45_005239 [Verticillium longisporum]
MAVETTVKLAVLIDADNVSPAMAAPLLAEVAKFGTAFARRAYGDWTGNSLRSWKEQLLTQSIQPVQQFAYTSGKNATDSAMIIDAMDLLYTNRFDGFCLASSDSDFTRLAARIRESGLVVYGFGERKTPKPFVAACDKFTHFENILYNDEQLVAGQPSLPAVATVPTAKASNSNAVLAQRSSQAVPSLKNEAQLAKQLRMAIEAASDEEGWANLAKVGGLITKQHPDFDPRTYGFTKLSELVIATELFYIDRRSPGAGKPMVIYARDKRQRRFGALGQGS